MKETEVVKRMLGNNCCEKFNGSFYGSDTVVRMSQSD